jgi:hypothetical protein
VLENTVEALEFADTVRQHRARIFRFALSLLDRSRPERSAMTAM